MLGRRSLSSDKKRGFRVWDGGLGAVEWGWDVPCGVPPPPPTTPALRRWGGGRPGSSPLGVGRALSLRGRLLVDLWRALPSSDPTRSPVLRGDVNCSGRPRPRVTEPPPPLGRGGGYFCISPLAPRPRYPRGARQADEV